MIGSASSHSFDGSTLVELILPDGTALAVHAEVEEAEDQLPGPRRPPPLPAELRRAVPPPPPIPVAGVRVQPSARHILSRKR